MTRLKKSVKRYKSKDTTKACITAALEKSVSIKMLY